MGDQLSHGESGAFDLEREPLDRPHPDDVDWGGGGSDLERPVRAYVLAAQLRWYHEHAFDFRPALAALQAPALFYAGAEDTFAYAAARDAAALVPRGVFVELPGLDHPQCFFASELVVPHVRRFLGAAG